MNVALRTLYAAAGAVASGLPGLTPASSGKVWRSLRARRGLRERFGSFAREHRDPRRPLLWMHAPSVGEGYQARPVLALLRQEYPDWQTAYTHFSPSAERFARDTGADFADYLPFDTPANARYAIQNLRPTALVFTKLDVWPLLVDEAARRGVGLALISGTLAPSSSRRSWLGRALLRDAYARLDAIGAIDAADAERLVALGVRADRIHVTGDTRYDQVDQRARRVERRGPLLAPFADGRPTLVAGSTWPADEQALLPAWREVRRRLTDARLIIAPHEPTEPHLAPIVRWAADSGLRLDRLDGPDAGGADVVLVDRVGVLGDLYAVAGVAFVGGGFHAAGLHSVLEPAAYGVPVLFGPRHAASRDARLLMDAGGAASAGDPSELAERIAIWLGDDPTAADAGRAARRVVERGLGAARQNADLVAALMHAGSAAR